MSKNASNSRLISRLLLPALIGLHVVVLSPVILGRKVFFQRDLFHYFYPLKWKVIEAFQQGRLPYWDESIFLGKSLLGDPSAGVFDPFNLLYFIFPFGIAFQWGIVLHFLLFSWGCYRLLEKLGANRAGAFLGAFTLSFSPAFQFLSNNLNYFSAYAFIPWVFFHFIDLLKRPQLRSAVWLAVLVAVQLFKSEPQVVYLEALCMLIAALFYRKIIPWLALSGLVAVGITLPVVVPCLDFLQSSIRGGGLAAQTVLSGSLHPLRLLEFILPYPWGNPLGGERYAPPFTKPNDLSTPWVISYYVGLPLLFGVFVLFPIKKTWRRPEVRLAFAGFFIFLILALGDYLGVFNRLFLFIPGWRLFRTPEKFMFFGQFSLVIGCALLWGELSEMRRILRKRPALGRVIYFGFLGLQVLMLFYIFWRSPLTREKEFFKQEPYLIRQYKRQLEGERFYNIRSSPKDSPGRYRRYTQEQWDFLGENVGSMFGVDYLAGYSTAIPQSFWNLWPKISENPRVHFNLYQVRFLLGNSEDFSDLSGLKLLWEEPSGSYRLYENLEANPRAWVVFSNEIPTITSPSASEIAVAIDESKNGLVKINAKLPNEKPGWLLYTANFDSHWKASRNGSAVKLQSIYPAVQAVELLPGENQIIFTYGFPGIRIYLLVSALFTAFAVGYLSFPKGFGKMRSKAAQKP